MDAAHDVMRRGPDLHRLLGDIDIAKRFELVIHARQLAFDELFRVWNFFLDPRDVQIDAAVRSPPPFLDFAHDATCDVIARE